MSAEEKPWHSLESADALARLESGQNGLSSDEAKRRLIIQGANVLEAKSGRSTIRILADQFKDILVIVLIVSALIALYMDELVNGSLILGIVILNGIFGFIQDHKAERNIEELKKLSKPKATVLRDGAEIEIGSESLVAGDILLLSEGDSVQADCRVLESVNMQVDESSLTGESVPAEKSPERLDEKTVLAERVNMVYRGTGVVVGRGRVVVVSTGMGTEIGKIARELTSIADEKTPFQRHMDQLGEKIALGIMAICAIVGLFIYFSTDTSPLDTLLIAIALGVAAIPEGLPAVITLSLALGSKRMVKKHALLRRLPVAESLGSVDVICTDKTGTLTENRMTVRKLYYDGSTYELSGAGHELAGEFTLSGKKADPQEIKPLLEAGLLNNNSKYSDGQFRGDPTETALMVAAMKAGLKPQHKRIGEIAFSSARKMMTTVHETPAGTVSYTKGAPETVIGRCDRILEHGKIRPITGEDKRTILEANDGYAREALRVIGFAYEDDTKTPEAGMIFLGLQGMIDPPRKEVPAALADCRSAGIRVIMITGDNKTTAQAVAKEIGLESGALEGKDLDAMSPDGLAAAVKDVSIFARVSPANKLAILQALKAQGHVVAMTGDGVNDAPAIKAADVGISMGQRGTEVAKQTSDIILLDDNFATIRDAILEGRRIFDNVQKFINYLFPCNLAEVLIVFAAALPFVFGSPMVILTAVQLLWINIATDGMPALALGVDPPAADIMQRKPRGRNEPIINGRVSANIILIGVAMTLIVLALFWLSDPRKDFARAQTIAFTAIVVFKMVRVYDIRISDKLGLLSNKWLLAAVGSSLLLHMVLLYSPAAAYFDVIPLTLPDWGLILLGLAAFAAISAGIRAMNKT